MTQNYVLVYFTFPHSSRYGLKDASCKNVFFLWSRTGKFGVEYALAIIFQQQFGLRLKGEEGQQRQLGARMLEINMKIGGWALATNIVLFFFLGMFLSDQH